MSFKSQSILEHRCGDGIQTVSSVAEWAPPPIDGVAGARPLISMPLLLTLSSTTSRQDSITTESEISEVAVNFNDSSARFFKCSS